MVLVILSYLLGSVSFGLLAANKHGVDLRAIGSGNIGATNVTRALGKKTGRVVMLLDAAKGFLPVALAQWVFNEDWPTIVGVGWAAAIGHCYPIWHRFSGGKGAATSAGVILGALPFIGLITAVMFLLTKKISHRASVASLLASTVAVALAFGLNGVSWPTYLTLGLLVLIVVRHVDNIGRLIRGEEPVSTSAPGD